MALYVDEVTTHNEGGGGNDTVPPGITGLDWCHLISDASKFELDGFIVDTPDMAQDLGNVRTPDLGANMTYVGLSADQRDAALAGGATAANRRFVLSHSFDQTGAGTFEP